MLKPYDGSVVLEPRTWEALSEAIVFVCTIRKRILAVSVSGRVA